MAYLAKTTIKALLLSVIITLLGTPIYGQSALFRGQNGIVGAGGACAFSTPSQRIAVAFGDGTHSTISETFASNPATGHLISVILFLAGTSTATVTIADGNGNTYTPTAQSPFVNSGTVQYIFYLLSAPSNASKTLTMTWSAVPTAGDGSFYAEDVPYSGCVLSFDTSLSGTGSGTAINTPSITPSGAGELLHSAAFPSNAVTAVGSPWTAGGADGPNNDQDAYILNSSAGATAVNYTTNISNPWIAVAAAYAKSGTSAFVQVAPFNFTTTTFSVAMPSNVTSGNSLVCAVMLVAFSNNFNTPTDTLSSTWTKDVDIIQDNNHINVWRATLASSGADTVSIGNSTGAQNGGACMEYRNKVTLDQAQSATGTNVTSYNGAAVTTTFAAETVIAAISGEAGGVTITSPFGTRAALTSSGSVIFAIADESVSSTGTYTPAATQSALGGFAAATISLH